MLIALFPSGAGISTIDENTETTFTGLLKGNGETVEALTGTQDQIVGFDENGNAIATSAPDQTVSDNTKTTITGLLKGNGATIEQAIAGEDYLAVPTINTYTLSSSGWSPSEDVQTQTLPVQGISSDETTQVVNIVPKTSDFKAYNDAGVYISKVADNSLTFECSERPSQNLTIYITIQKAIKGVVA